MTKIILLSITLLFHFFHTIGGEEPIQVFFSPEEDCGAEILKRIEESKKSIDAAIYLFTSRTLSRAIVNAHNRGVKVRIILEGENVKDKFSKDEFLREKGIPIRIREDRGIMHNKFSIIDGEILITGSYNWTHSADLYNDENLLILKIPEVIKTYEAYFERLWRGEVPESAVYSDTLTLRKR